MKQILLLVFLLTINIAVEAQDYNFGFENWINYGNYEEPEYWGTFNPVQFVGIQAIKDTHDIYHGNYSLKLSSGLIPAAVAVLGTINVNSALIKPGRPYTQRPVKFKCVYKLTLVNNDSAAVVAFITKFNSTTQQRDTIAFAGKIFYQHENTKSWTPLEIDFEYESSDTPDTLGIILSSTANPDGLGNEGCELYVDAIELEVPSSASINETNTSGNFQIFPNPANDELFIVSTNQSQASYIHIYDLAGKKILSHQYTEQNIISLKNFHSGKYIVKIENNNVVVFSGSFLKK